MVTGRVGWSKRGEGEQEAGPPHSHGDPEGSTELALRSTSEDQEEEESADLEPAQGHPAPVRGPGGLGPAWEQTSEAENRPAPNIHPEASPAPPPDAHSTSTSETLLSPRWCLEEFCLHFKASWSSGSQGSLRSLGLCSTAQGLRGGREEPSVSTHAAQVPSPSGLGSPQPRGPHASASVACL